MVATIFIISLCLLMKIELLSPVSTDVSHSKSDIRFCTAEDEKILSWGLVGLLVSDSVSDPVVFGLYQKTVGCCFS